LHSTFMFRVMAACSCITVCYLIIITCMAFLYSSPTVCARVCVCVCVFFFQCHYLSVCCILQKNSRNSTIDDTKIIMNHRFICERLRTESAVVLPRALHGAVGTDLQVEAGPAVELPPPQNPLQMAEVRQAAGQPFC